MASSGSTLGSLDAVRFWTHQLASRATIALRSDPAHEYAAGMRIVNQLLHRRLNSGRREFPTFGCALAACGDVGYESEELARVVVEKTRRLITSQNHEVPPSGILLAAASLEGRGSSLRVVDIGGAAGAHYLGVRMILPQSVRLEWVVVETGAMISAADAIHLGPEVRFSTDLNASLGRWESPPDLVLASGVLMCLPEPRESLEQICASSAASIVFTRTGLAPAGATRIIVQSSRLADNGPGPLPQGFTDRLVRYPNTFIPRAEFEKVLSRNHEIRFSASEMSRAWRVGKQRIPQFAYVAHLRGTQDEPGAPVG